ncbi:MAG: sigma-70 family RNA polymerase sigma factor [Clostridiaceae bacterium]
MDHTGLIHAVIKQLPFLYEKGSSLEYKDCFQIGFIAFLEALEGFDSDKGTLGTYITPRIKWALLNAHKSLADTIRKPGYIHQAYSEYKKAVERFMKEHEREPNLKQIARILQKTPEEILTLKRAFSSVESMQLPLPGTEDITVADAVPDERDDYEEVELSLCRQQLHKDLDILINETLQGNEQQAVRLYYAFDGGPIPSMKTVAASMGVSEQYVGQLLQKALRKLRKHSRLFIAKYPEYMAHEVYRSFGANNGSWRRHVAIGLFQFYAAVGDLIEMNDHLMVITELEEDRFWGTIAGKEIGVLHRGIKDIEIKNEKITRLYVR